MSKIPWMTVAVLAVLAFVAWHFISPAFVAATKSGSNATSNPVGGTNNTQPDAFTSILTGVLGVYKGLSTVAQTAPRNT